MRRRRHAQRLCANRTCAPCHHDAVCVLLALLALILPNVTRADDVVRPLPPVAEDAGASPTIFDRIRLAALGDPQDLTEPLLPDDVAPPGQPRQEFEPPAGRKLPPGAKPGPLQQVIFTTTELPRLGGDGLGLTTLDGGVAAAHHARLRHDLRR
jgi:hypothetical protein